MTYIYLNTYNGSVSYLYVGSHTWDGEGLDPNYHGSSAVANRYGWLPDKIEILEVVTDDTLHRERYWIEKYAEQYGIADCVFIDNNWTRKYKRHGRLLNGHANEASQMHTPEIYQKSLDTKKATGVYEMAIRALVECDHSNSYTESAMRKRCATVKSKGTSCYSPEVYDKRAETIKRNKTNAFYKKRKIVRVTGEGVSKEGVLHRICVELGHPTWDTTIVQKFKKSSVVFHRGYKFEWINRMDQ